jgi:hypothetical protein
MDDITRVCRKCGQEKPLEEFVKNKTSALGRKHICKQCEQERYRKWRAANSEKRWEYNRKWHAANPEKRWEYNRKWRAANPEKIREIRHKWREANTEKEREGVRKYRAANHEKVREWVRKYRAANPEKEREKIRKYREKLTDGYLIYLLKKHNLPIIPEIIDYKRIQLKLYREIKNQQNDERD